MDESSKKRLEEIIAKDKNDLIQEDIDFLKARRSYLNDEQRVRFAEFLDEGEVKVPRKKRK